MGLSKKDIREKLSEGYLQVRVILQVVGAPKEHIDTALNEHVKKMESDKSVMIIEKTINDAEPNDNMFLAFAEMEFMIKDASALAYFCFDYMPSSIEIIEPEIFTYKAHDFTSFFNDLQARLHQLNGLVKNVMAENKLLSKNAALLLRNNIMICLKEKQKDIKTLSKNVGIAEEQLEPFLKKIMEEGFIKKEGDDYVLKKG